jgi:hypothetical protein
LNPEFEKNQRFRHGKSGENEMQIENWKNEAPASA